MATERVDVHAEITSQIIAAIEAGVGPVVLPWHRSEFQITRPKNIQSGNAYRGINTLSLWASAYIHGFEHGLWGTYRQWQAQGAQVKKGEKSSVIVFYKEFDAENDKGEEVKRFVARGSRVFNVSQVEGYSVPEEEKEAQEIEPIKAVEAFISNTKAIIREDGHRAFYSLKTDEVTMPERTRFKSAEDWYSVLLHELTHWSGAEKRMNRQFGQKFGDDAYAIEELVAELGAAFMCGDLGISLTPREDHAAYIDHWLRIMKGDNRAIFAAASAASRDALKEGLSLIYSSWW